MNILICPAHNYVMPYGIMLESLFSNNESDDIKIYAIVDEDVSEEDKKALNNIAKKHDSRPIIYHTFSEKLLNTYPALNDPHSHVNRATYFKLFAAEILPCELDKILYLDGDIIVMDSLQKIWEKDIETVAVAGVLDQNQSYQQYNRLHYPSYKGYINAGVLLINLEYWRKHQIGNCFIDFIYKYPERIKWHDQDVLNYVLKDEKKLLPLNYNVQHSFYWKPKYCYMDYWSRELEIVNAQQQPMILHFTGEIKPWHKKCQHPRTCIFLDYKKRTIWKDTPLYSLKTTSIQKCCSYARKALICLHILTHRIPINKYIDE